MTYIMFQLRCPLAQGSPLGASRLQFCSHLAWQKRIFSSLITTSLDAPQAPQNRQNWHAAEKHQELVPLFPPHVVVSAVSISFSKYLMRSALTFSTIGHVPSLIQTKFSLQPTRQPAHGTVEHSLCSSSR